MYISVLIIYNHHKKSTSNLGFFPHPNKFYSFFNISVLLNISYYQYLIHK